MAGRHLAPAKKKKAISLLAVVALLVTLLPVVPAIAAQVTGVSATATGYQAGAAGVTYDITFTATSGIGPGDEITVTFGTGYSVPSNLGTNEVSITFQSNSYTPASVIVSGTIVRIGVPAELTVGAGGSVEVGIPRITNPTQARNYSIAVRTTSDTAGSTTVTIVAADAAKVDLDVPGQAVRNQVVPLTVTIQDQYDNPTTMAGDLTVTFAVYESGSSSAVLYADADASRQLADNKLIVTAGSQGGQAYLKDSEAETVTIVVYNDGSLNDPQPATITVDPAGELARLVFSQKPAQITAGAAGNFTVQLQDAYGNPVNASEETDVTLVASGASAATVSWAGVNPDPEDNLKAAGTIPALDNSLSFAFSDTRAASNVYITASISAPLQLSATAIFNIVPAVADHFFLAVPDAYDDPAEDPDTVVEINSGQRSSLTIEVRDQYENPVSQDTPLSVQLATNSATGNGQFYATATSEAAITEAQIPADAASVTVYYGDTLRPENGVQLPVTLTATSDGLTGQVPVVLMGPRPEQLVIAGGDSIEVNLRTPLTIQLLDQYGDPYAVSEETEVNLSDGAGGEFYPAATGGTASGTATLAAGESEVTVYYRPVAVGVRTVTASARVAVTGTAGFEVQGAREVAVRPAGQTANRLVVTAGSIVAGTRGEVAVTVTDQYGNPVAQDADLAVSLGTGSTTGAFYAAAEGGEPIGQAVIVAGESSLTVYYADTTAGTAVLSASAPGLDSGTGSVEVRPAGAAAISITGESAVTVNQRAELSFAVVDRYGNAVTQESPITLVLATTSATGYFVDGSGKRLTQVTVSAGASSAVAYYTDGAAGQAILTATTTGLQPGSFTITVEGEPAEDTTAPGEVTDLGVAPAPGAGTFTLSFTTLADADLAAVKVYISSSGGNDWAYVGEVEVAPSEQEQVPVQVGPAFTLNGSDRVRFKVVTVDRSGNPSAGVVAENEGQGYEVLACWQLEPGPEGWVTFSVPVRLAGGEKLLGDVINLEDVDIAYKFDAGNQEWVQVTADNNTIEPLEAVYVKLNHGTLATIRPTVAPTNPPVKELLAGWNLVGPTDKRFLSSALSSVGGLWSVAVSPAVNPDPWAATPGQVEFVETHYGYWVYMNDQGKLAGFSSTPVTVGTYPFAH